jgi:hypothetical protein
VWVVKQLLSKYNGLPLVLMFLQELKCPKALEVFIIAKYWQRICIQWLMQVERTFIAKNIVKMTIKLFTKPNSL